LAIVAEVPLHRNRQRGQRVGNVDTGTGRDYQVGEFEQSGILFPRGDVAEGVKPDDKEAFPRRIGPAQDF
jgi:hypothetical protein